MIDVIVPTLVVLLLYVLIKPNRPRQRSFEILFPEQITAKTRNKLLRRLSRKAFPMKSPETSLEEYLAKLLPYMAMRCRSLGFPEGCTIIIRAANQEYVITI